MIKSLNSMKCENVECGYEGSFDVKKQGWYWPVVIIGLMFLFPLWLFLLLHKNRAICPECSVESHEEPLVRKPKTGQSKIFKVVIWFFLAFIAFIFYMALIGKDSSTVSEPNTVPAAEETKLRNEASPKSAFKTTTIFEGGVITENDRINLKSYLFINDKESYDSLKQYFGVDFVTTKIVSLEEGGKKTKIENVSITKNLKLSFHNGVLVKKSHDFFTVDYGNYITLEQYNKIEKGMTYQDVVEVIGFEGVSFVTEYKGSFASKVHSEKFRWSSKGVKNSIAIISFNDGKVVFKNERGLE